MNRRVGWGRFIECSYCIGEHRVSCAEPCIEQGHSFGSHSALKHGITAVTTINFSMGSVAIMTYSWHTLSYWPDRQYWFIEETPMLSWQPEVMVGGNRAGDEEGCSLSFDLYCCYRFPIRKKDGPLYWPTTSMKVCLNHTGQQRPSYLSAIHDKCDTVQGFCSMCVFVPGWCYYLYAWFLYSCIFCAYHIHVFVSFVLIGLFVKWLRLLKEVHRVQLSCVLANADQNYAHSPPNSTPLW